jgi:hypothetical protein
MNEREMGRALGRAVKDNALLSSIPFVLMAQAEQIDDVTIAEHPEVFSAWSEQWTGKRGAIVRDGDALYRSIHDVGAGQNMRPSGTPSMWTRIADPGEEWPQWSQPIGAHDAYVLGDKVTHGGGRWVSTAAGNVWEPGVYGWSAA